MEEGGAAFEVAERADAQGVYEVRGGGGFTGQVAVFSGPDARTRAVAYARWMNAGGAHQRRRTDPGFKLRGAPGA